MTSDEHAQAPAPDLATLRVVLFVVFAVSGFAGLIYEAVWGRYLRLLLGHSAYAQTFVIAIFMGGMAIGAWIASRRSTRWSSLLKAYAITEFAIGVFALCFHSIFEAAMAWSYSTALPSLSSPLAIAVFKQGLSVLLIILPSVLLGMTFPLMSGAMIRIYPGISGASLSMLYFSNSMGAALGVMLTGFVLVAAIGLPGTVMLAGVINILIGLVCLLISNRVVEPELVVPDPTDDGASDPPGGPSLLLAVAGFTGLASFIYEIAWIRMLSLLLGSSSHAFEIMLATFIAGLALGGLWIKRHIDSLSEPIVFLARVQWIMGALAILTVFFYNSCTDLMVSLMAALARTPEGYFLFNVGSNVLAAAVMFPAAFCAGMTLPLITYTLLRRNYGERSIGAVYASNTVGAIVGVLFATHIGLPLLGLKGLVVTGALIDMVLGLVLLWRGAPKVRLRGAVAATVLVIVAAGQVEFDPIKMASGVYRGGDQLPPNDTIIRYHRDGKTASVDVYDIVSDRTRTIATNGKPDASLRTDLTAPPTTDSPTQTLLGALPLALSPNARTVAVIGFGSGMTSAVLLESPTLTQVDTIEIEPAMVEGARLFRPQNDRVYDDPRSKIIYEDARTYFSAQQARYDIIVSEPSNPWVSGIATLFSAEFYRRIAIHLNEGGLLVQWVQLYELDLPLFASLMAALSDSFDDYVVFAADNHNAIIIASNGRVGGIDKSIFENDGLRSALARYRLTDAHMLDSHRIGDRQALEPLLQSYGVPMNSDYFPYLDVHAARSRFERKSSSPVLALAQTPIPILEMLGRQRQYGPAWVKREIPGKTANQLVSLTHVERAATAQAIGRRMLGLPQTNSEQISRALINATERLRLGLSDCDSGSSTPQPTAGDILSVGAALTTSLDPESLHLIWQHVMGSPCFDRLTSAAKQWTRLFAAAGQRDAEALRGPAAKLLKSGRFNHPKEHEIALSAAMVSAIVMGRNAEAQALWHTHAGGLLAKIDTQLPLRLLAAHMHVDRGDPGPRSLRLP